MKRLFVLITALLVLLPISTCQSGVLGDINNDGKVGLPEAVYAQQVAAGLRSPIPQLNEGELFDITIRLGQTTSSQTIMTVPSGKIFILTDLVTQSFTFSSSSDVINIFQTIGDNGKSRFGFYSQTQEPYSFHFNSGIKFDSGARIDIYHSDSASSTIFISGYLIPNN